MTAKKPPKNYLVDFRVISIHYQEVVAHSRAEAIRMVKAGHGSRKRVASGVPDSFRAETPEPRDQ